MLQKQRGFQLSVGNNFAFASVLFITALLVGEVHAIFSANGKPDQKPIVSCSLALSRAKHWLLVFGSNSDRFIALFTSAMIGQDDCFGFGFTTLN